VALAGSALFRAGLLDLAGNDALPQRILSIRLDFWQVLAGGRPAWPGARVLPEAGGAFAPEGGLAAAAAALGSGTTAGIVLRGPPGSGRGAAAAWVAAQLGRVPMEVAAATLHDDRAFAAACDACEWLPVLRLPAEAGDAPHPAGATPCIFLAGPRGAVDGEQLIQVALAPQGAAARRRLWRAALGAQGDGLTDGILDAAVLYPAAIEAAGRGARLLAAGRKVTPSDLRAARLTLAPEALGRLAHPVARDVHAAALVAAPGLAADLETFVARCRQRESLWEGLGPSLAASATRGVRALFAGESGTGKTMAASYVATALAAPLYRCDLAAVMNKYIGESEKNLGALLDHAEAADAVLLFDEADALFGRRGEGSETGERYANMLTNYLLTRLEAHDGIVILTANSKARIDPAFWRRLDQVIDFPTPGYEERLKLWRSHLGCRAPDEAEMMRLAAYCDLPGGSVRNVVLAAAALVPPGGEIGLDSLSPALRREYAKLRRPLPAGLALALRAAG
jgi:hypothetical protein